MPPARSQSSSSPGTSRHVTIPLDWHKWADEQKALREVADQLRKDGWFTVPDLCARTGWQDSAARMRCTREVEWGNFEKKIAVDATKGGHLQDTAFYRPKRKVPE